MTNANTGYDQISAFLNVIATEIYILNNDSVKKVLVI